MEIITVGRLAAMKGFAVLLDAVAELLAEDPDVRLTIVGDGPDRAQLEARAHSELPAGAVTFAGALGPEGVAKRLRGADLFCLPSFAEGVPVVLMEAMAAGLPVVSTAVMGIPELVRRGAGTLVPPGRADVLADALRAYVRDPEARARDGAVGREIVARDFDVDDSAGQLARLFTASVS